MEYKHVRFSIILTIILLLAACTPQPVTPQVLPTATAFTVDPPNDGDDPHLDVSEERVVSPSIPCVASDDSSSAVKMPTPPVAFTKMPFWPSWGAAPVRLARYVAIEVI